jgi:hypothetical protein
MPAGTGAGELLIIIGIELSAMRKLGVVISETQNDVYAKGKRKRMSWTLWWTMVDMVESLLLLLLLFL